MKELDCISVNFEIFSFLASDLRKDQISSEVNYRPHPHVGFPTELQLQVASPPVKR